ncbi:MAG: Rieske (2Fe-2S) protein [Paludisphaera borealis]|uniref:Rieske (2Fe-2S) protein n=1 Tax=Paludisphaera borealis TaxID=1387353 RepID=UPI002848609F|nr:Rieske (2Fe-2S) protein [Paludisphaera borealis]MDR3619615.1 Rieske (2Fe-2S) protein [Paludisphaera borealis]
MPEWVYLCRIDEVPDGRARTIEVAGARVAVIRDGDSIVVISDLCPHAGGSLGSGWIEEGELLCPLHRWRFRLRDGRCTTVRGNDVHRYPSRVDDRAVWARV